MGGLITKNINPENNTSPESGKTLFNTDELGRAYVKDSGGNTVYLSGDETIISNKGVGLLADRPSESLINGDVYTSTDTLKKYTATGLTSWDEGLDIVVGQLCVDTSRSTFNAYVFDGSALGEIGGLGVVDILTFDTSGASRALVEGEKAYDPIAKTTITKSPFNTAQDNQEQWQPVRNHNAYEMPEGSLVRFVGWNGEYHLIDFADNSTEEGANWDGMLTNTIPAYTGSNDEEVIGAMVTNGFVNDLDTSSCEENDNVYLGKLGAWTCDEPSAPDYIRIAGKIGRKDATDGSVYVRWSGNDSGDFEERFIAMNTPHGIPRDQKELIILTYDAATRTITVNGQFYFYHNAHKHIVDWTDETLQHADASGEHFIYFDFDVDDNVILSASVTPWTFGTVVPLAIVVYNNDTASTYWDGQNGKLMCERHGCEMDKATHEELHFTMGCWTVSGWALSGYIQASGSGSLEGNTFSIDSGTIHDEDNATLIPMLPDNNGVGNSYTVWHKNGANWQWFETNLPYLIQNSNIVYNQIISGVGSLVELTSNGEYSNIYIIGTPELDKSTGLPSNKSFGFILGQESFGSLIEAQTESIFDLELAGFPSQEVAPLYKITFRRANTYLSDVGKARIELVTRIVGTRFISSSQSSSPSIHNNLSGRSELDTHPASSITNTPEGNIEATTVQAAINELDTEKQGIHGATTAADQLKLISLDALGSTQITKVARAETEQQFKDIMAGSEATLVLLAAQLSISGTLAVGNSGSIVSGAFLEFDNGLTITNTSGGSAHIIFDCVLYGSAATVGYDNDTYWLTFFIRERKGGITWDEDNTGSLDVRISSSAIDATDSEGSGSPNIVIGDENYWIAQDKKGIVALGNVSGTTTIDWSKGDVFTATITASTTITDTLLKQSKQIVLKVTGDFALAFPSYYTLMSGTYDGTVDNYIYIDCLNNTASSEEVLYYIDQE